VSDLEDLAARIKDIEDRVGSRNATQLDSSTIDVGENDESIVLGDVVVGANESIVFTIPGLQEALDLNETRLQEASEAVQAAMDAADAAEEAGLAAGEEASQAADEALVKAQEALDAAAAAGGGAVYTNRAPTAADPGKPGSQWFVWDANYHVTGYYVYTDDTVKWVATVLDDGTFGNLSAARLTSGFIDAARIAAGSLTAAVLAADTITSREIAADAILARNIKALEITGAKIAAATITGGNIAANTIVAGNIKAGTITANEIAAGTITANEINLTTLNGKTINGVTITAATITGALIRTAASGGRVEVVQNKNVSGDPYQRGAVQFIDTAGNIAKLSPGAFGTSGVLTLAVGSLDSSGSFSGETTVAFGTSPGIPDIYPGTGAALPSPPKTMWVETGAVNIFAGAVGSLNSQRTGRVLVYDGAWRTPAISNAVTDPTYPVRYRLYNGVVYFDGLLGLTSSSTGATLFQLPPGYRPEVARQQFVNRGGGTAQWVLRIQAGGNVALPATTSAGGSGSLEFGGIAPFIADN
jgi:hypothetical protein